MDAVGSGKESIANRFDVPSGQFHKDASFISVRRNSLRGICDSAERSGRDTLSVDERHQHLLMVTIARNRIGRVKERFPYRLLFTVLRNRLLQHASLGD